MALDCNSAEGSPPAPRWLDEMGTIHICESAQPMGAELLVWTLCDREVESGAARTSHDSYEVTCSKCAAARLVMKRRGAAFPDATACSSIRPLHPHPRNQ